MKKVAFVSHKGGVGKTTCSLAFAECLTGKGRRVLFIDLTDQMSATQLAEINTDDRASIYDLLTSNYASIAETIHRTAYYDIIPSDRLMVRIEQELSSHPHPHVRLSKRLKDLDQNDYDYVVIDCPPSLGLATINAMTSSDEVIVVVNPDPASIASANTSCNLASEIKRNPHLNPKLEIAGLLVNRYDPDCPPEYDFEAALTSLANTWNTKTFLTRIRSCETVRQAQVRKRPLSAYDPSCEASRDFKMFTSEYENQSERIRALDEEESNNRRMASSSTSAILFADHVAALRNIKYRSKDKMGYSDVIRNALDEYLTNHGCELGMTPEEVELLKAQIPSSKPLQN